MPHKRSGQFSNQSGGQTESKAIRIQARAKAQAEKQDAKRQRRADRSSAAQLAEIQEAEVTLRRAEARGVAPPGNAAMQAALNVAIFANAAMMPPSNATFQKYVIACAQYLHDGNYGARSTTPASSPSALAAGASA